MEGLAATGLEVILAANAALLLSGGLLWLITRAICAVGLGRDWTLRRTLTNATWLMALGLPVVWLAAPGLMPAAGLNATDIVVGYFLRGHIDISATELTELLALRDRLPQALLNPAGPIWTVLAVTLGLAALIRAASVLRSAWRVRGILSDAMLLRDRGTVKIHISERCAVPFATRGLRSYHVVLPAYLAADGDAFRIALGHELQHIRQGDPWMELGVAILSPIFALNPAFWALARQTRRLREHDCDAACVARSGGDARAYCLTLLAVAKRARGDDATPGTFSVPLLGRRQMSLRPLRSQLGHRITLLAQAPGRRAGLCLTVTLVLCLTAALTTTAWLLRSPTDWSHERLELSSVLNLERLETINTLRQRPLR